MSVPRIPGYIDQPEPNNLADLWSKPDASFPDELWPTAALAQIVRDPIGWLTVEEHFHFDEIHGGRGCVVVPTGGVGAALQSTNWIGRDLGNVGIWGDDTFEDGLTQADDERHVEFFVQARQPSGVVLPVIDVALPFLWYYDAFPVANGWQPRRTRAGVDPLGGGPGSVEGRSPCPGTSAVPVGPRAGRHCSGRDHDQTRPSEVRPRRRRVREPMGPL